MNQYSDYRNYYMSEFLRNEEERQMKMGKSNNNMKFNECGYDQKGIGPNNLYDPYQGFIRGNLFPDLYNTYKVNKPFEVEPMNEQAKLLTILFTILLLPHSGHNTPVSSSELSLF